MFGPGMCVHVVGKRRIKSVSNTLRVSRFRHQRQTAVTICEFDICGQQAADRLVYATLNVAQSVLQVLNLSKHRNRP